MFYVILFFVTLFLVYGAIMLAWAVLYIPLRLLIAALRHLTPKETK